MMFRASAFCCVLAFASLSFAQIIYQPVRYQYGVDSKFYYGGSDPAVIARGYAEKNRCGRAYNDLGGPIRVYSDAYPFWNARLFGCSPDDARNEAYANIPRYFRKGDLLNAAQRQDDGSLVIPAQAQPRRVIIVNHDRDRTVAPTSTKPATKPEPILIIPKDLLKQKLWTKPNPLASAQ